MRTAPSVRVFGVVSDDGTAAGLRPIDTRVTSFSGGCPGREHLWMVDGMARERLHWAALPEGPQAITTLGVARQSVLRLRVIAVGSALGATFELDLGQSVELVAETLHVDLLGPTGSLDLTEQTTPPPQTGLLFDSLCFVRLLRLEVSRGQSSARLTETFTVLGGQAHAQPIPTAARRLTIYLDPPAALATMQWRRGESAPDGSTAAVLGVMSGVPSGEVEVPAATHLLVQPGGADRTFTFVWTITP